MSTQTRDLHYEWASSYRYIGNALRVVNTTVECSYYNIITHLFHITRHVLYANFVRLTAPSIYTRIYIWRASFAQLPGRRRRILRQIRVHNERWVFVLACLITPIVLPGNWTPLCTRINRNGFIAICGIPSIWRTIIRRRFAAESSPVNIRRLIDDDRRWHSKTKGGLVFRN